MSEKTVSENPTISDKIVFELNTPNIDGSTSSNPYEFSKIVIYFVSRDYASGNLQKYENQDEVKGLDEFYFREAEPIHVIGDENYPAWLSTDTANALIENTGTCSFKYIWEAKSAREGDYFICWTWKPLPAGDSVSNYFKFYLAGDTQQTTIIPTHYTNPKKYETLLSKYLPEMFKLQIAGWDESPDVLDRLNKSVASGFNVLEDFANQIVDLQDANSLHEFLLPYLSNYLGLKLKTEDPTRWRKQIKRAVPLYKRKGTKGGLTEALDHIGAKLNKINQLWQILSSHTWQDVFVFDGENKEFTLSKTMILPVDTDNFELWIRPKQELNWIKLNDDYLSFMVNEGITKATLIGETLTSIAIELFENDQIRILYKYKELQNQNEQDIENYIRSLPLMDTRDTRSQVKAKTKINSDIITGLPINSEFRVGQGINCYEFEGTPTVVEIVNYSTIRVSSNATSTNNDALIVFNNFDYPPKNWNLRAIKSDDPMFNIIVPERNPFFDPIVFGKVRTEFPYSENIYNMEEYNGSIRDSKNPCDIDKNFVDTCYACASSSYDIDLEVEQLSDDKIFEAKSVIKENTPFHSVVHTFNFIGSFDEFVEPPQENLEMLMTYFGSDFVVSGHAQSYFFRNMIDVESEGIKRSELADSELVFSGSGVASNDEILLFCPDVVLSNSGISPAGDSFITIKNPSSLSGDYVVGPSTQNTLKILYGSDLEPIDDISSPFSGGNFNPSAFTFDLNNVVKPITGSLCNISQSNIYNLSDGGYDFSKGVDHGQIKTQKDVYSGTSAYAWEVELSYGRFLVQDIVNGELIIDHDPSLPSSDKSNESWSLIDNGVIVESSNNGKIKVRKRALVTSLNPFYNPVKNDILNKDCYQVINGIEYKVSDMLKESNNQYYLEGYDQGGMAGVSIDMREKLVKNKVGYLSYRGLKLKSPATESFLGIQNGGSYLGGELIDNNYFKENFIVVINGISYWIYEIINDVMTLSGSPQYLGTTGSPVNFQIFRYEKKGATIMGQQFDLPEHTFPTIDRDGESVIFSDSLENGHNTVSGLAESNENQVIESINQKEDISYKIEYKGEENE